MRENEKLKNERGQRKQFLYGQGGAGGAGASKFTPQLFGQTLLKGMAQKENSTAASQMFPAGSFQKYIGSNNGDGMSDKSGDVVSALG
mgnify:CR=1 FL=1